MSLAKRLSSFIWSTVNGSARALSQREILKKIRLPARVISIGNIQAGGAGKTPLTAQIAREAHERGLGVCILIRGYRGAWERMGGIIAPGQTEVDVAQSGDEAALLHDLAPRAWIGVGADRVKQFEEVAKAAGKLDLVLLDDGFQNWKISKDVELVAVTEATPSTRIFRDSFDALKNADLVVWTKGDRYGSVARNLPVLEIAYVRFELPPPSGEESEKEFWLVTGLADGNAAVLSARQAGYNIRRHVDLSDHVKYTRRSVEMIQKLAKQDGCRIALTGKDWVKWRPLGISKNDVLVLEPKLLFEEGRNVWERVLWGK